MVNVHSEHCGITNTQTKKQNIANTSDILCPLPGTAHQPPQDKYYTDFIN